jgi:hypothetical protein
MTSALVFFVFLGTTAREIFGMVCRIGRDTLAEWLMG